MIKLNKYMKRLSVIKQKGFTLIELLVVIGILGILAAALVATIDPFEQLKKATDSKIKNMLVEFQTANIRYYTTHGAFPWSDTTSTNNACITLTGTTYGGTIGNTDITSAPLGTGALLANCIGVPVGTPPVAPTNSLVGDGELKAGFVSNTNDLNLISLTWDHTTATEMRLCFSPTSKSQKASGETIYNEDGTPHGAGCPDANADDGTCWWCTQ
jgi:prepilin-type N-terminal cleavage/methylation domain-containing protein